MGRVEEAGKIYETIETRFPNYGFAVKVLMSRGICAELLGHADEAGRFYESILGAYPQSIEATLAEQRLADLRRPLFQ